MNWEFYIAFVVGMSIGNLGFHYCTDENYQAAIFKSIIAALLLLIPFYLGWIGK